MKSTILRKLSGVALTLAMLVGIGIAASGTAQAQIWGRDRDRRDDRRDDDRYDRYGYDDRVRWDKQRLKDYAFTLGYHNAYTEGRESYERGYRVNYKDMPGYREGTNGWFAWMGDRDTYRDYYRKGYEQGFKDGQSNRARRYDRRDVERILGNDVDRVYGRDPYYGGGRDRRGHDDDDYNRRGRGDIIRIAQENGYRDGQNHGAEDRARRRGYDYDHSSEYRDALRGYRSEYGDRDTYRRAYRQGYQRGYDEGYRRGDNRSRGTFRWPF